MFGVEESVAASELGTASNNPNCLLESWRLKMLMKEKAIADIECKFAEKRSVGFSKNNCATELTTPIRFERLLLR